MLAPTSPAKSSGRKRLYRCWYDMHTRCENSKRHDFKNYGGRGISVCERWKCFEAFLEDMGEGKKGWTIERINNDLGYSLENCCWATRAHQNRNRRGSVRVTACGLTGNLRDVCARLGLNYGTVRARLRRGYSPDRAFLVVREVGKIVKPKQSRPLRLRRTRWKLWDLPHGWRIDQNGVEHLVLL